MRPCESCRSGFPREKMALTAVAMREIVLHSRHAASVSTWRSTASTASLGRLQARVWAGLMIGASHALFWFRPFCRLSRMLYA